MVSRNLQLFPKLVLSLWSKDPLIRMGAADAAEKVTRKNPELLAPYRKELLGLLGETKEQELRWHLAVMVPRLALNSNERQLAISFLNSYMQDRSSIVKTFALQSLAGLGPGIVELAGLSDDDRAGADDQNAVDVRASRHSRP